MSSTDLGTSEDTVVNTTSSSASGSPCTTPSVITFSQPQPSPNSSNVIQLTALTTATARTENCMSTPGPPEWRPYAYEHPLTAATTAMLNINGGGSDDPNSSGFGILYDYHYSKLESLGSASASDLIKSENKLSADIWSPVVVTNVLSGGNGNSSSKHTNGEMTEIFVPSTTIQSSSAKLTSVLRRGAGADSKLGTKLNGHRYTNGDSSSLSPPSEHHQHNSHTHNHSPLSNSNGNGVIIVKEEIAHSPDHDQHAQYRSPQLFATLSNPSHGGGGSTFDFGTGGNGTSVVVSSAQFISSLRGGGAPSANGGSMTNIYPVGTSPSDPYYRVDYFANEFGASGVTTASRQLSPYDGTGTDGPSFVDRYVRPGGPYKPHGGLPVDLPSPDSGIGTEAITPRDHSNIQQGFDYTDLCHPGLINDIGTNSNNTEGRLSPGGTTHPNLKRPWHDFGRQNETDKIQIPKLFSNYGLRYYLESPISTSQRREDDRITYINKGQFYGITLEYIPDPEKPIKSQTVKTVVMLVFREEKSPEDEIKAWQFWHGRQHSVKQRILDADTKNSVGLVGCIDEIAHNAIAVYWNPHESSAKINVAVQCLSTDFSSQKGVKGLPLHLQIDTYEDPRDPNCPVFHRGYCQIKVFCDKGAERKTRDEERRAAKRKLTATGRKKLDEMYHSSCDRSEFYTMSETSKPPVLFTPAEDLDKLTSLELHGFYNTNSEGSDHTGVNNNGGSESNNNNTTIPLLHGSAESPQSIAESVGSAGSGLCGSGSSTPAHHSQHPIHHHHHHHQSHHHHHQTNPPSVLNIHHPPSTILKFHHSFPPESPPAPYAASNIMRSAEHSSPSPAPTPSPQPQPSSSHSQSARTNEKKSEHHQHGGVLVIGSGLDPAAALSTNNSNSVPTPNGGSIVSNDNSNVYGSSSSSSSDTPIIKRMRLPQPTSERLMLYARQESENTFTPLHLVPPTTMGLLSALEEKYKISMSSVKNLYRRNSKGIVAKIDDDMLRHYCHEDSFLLDVKPSENEDAFDVTLTELADFPIEIQST